jgi:hypothetical protein
MTENRLQKTDSRGQMTMLEHRQQNRNGKDENDFESFRPISGGSGFPAAIMPYHTLFRGWKAAPT